MTTTHRYIVHYDQIGELRLISVFENAYVSISAFDKDKGQSVLSRLKEYTET